MLIARYRYVLFFFNDTATTEIYTLAHTTLFRSSESFQSAGCGFDAHGADRVDLHSETVAQVHAREAGPAWSSCSTPPCLDRKSTRLNSSHANISYAVFCLTKKHNNNLYIRKSAH